MISLDLLNHAQHAAHKHPFVTAAQRYDMVSKRGKSNMRNCCSGIAVTMPNVWCLVPTCLNLTRERERDSVAHTGIFKPWNTCSLWSNMVKLCLAPREAMPVPAPVPVPRKKVAAQKDSQRPSGTTLQRIALGCKRTLGRNHSKSSSRKYPRIFNNLQQTGNSHPRLSVI